MKIKEVINNNKKDIAILFAMVGFSFIICFNFLKPHYPSDAYYMSAYGYEPYINTFLASNRIFCALLLKIYIKLNIPLNMQMCIMGTLMTLAMAIGWFVLYKIVNKLLDKKESFIHELIIVFATFIIIFNICTAEGLLFVEDATSPFGILFAILGAGVFAGNRKGRYIISLGLVTIAGLLYQGTASIFVILALLFSFIKNTDNKKEIIKEIFIIGFIYGLAMIINFIGIKIWTNILNFETRKFIIPDILTIWSTIVKYGKLILIENCGILSGSWYLAIILFVSVIFIINIIKEKKDYCQILEYLLLILISILIPIVPIILTPVELQYLEPRMAMSFGIIIGVLIIYVISKINIEKRKSLIKAIVVISALNFVINSMYMIDASSSILRVNKIEENISMQIIKEIDDYENKTNIEIKGIGIAFDKNYSMYYKGEPNLRGFNIRGLGISWAVKEIITTYSGKNFHNVETPENIRQMFLEKDWDYYNSEQLYFEGENLYICIF